MENFPIFNGKETDYTDFLVGEAQKKRYVLDTSVASKWYYQRDESDIDSAEIFYEALKSKNIVFFAPDLLIYELLNIYRTKLDLDDVKVRRIITEINDLVIILGVNNNTFIKAFLHARKFNISFYDSVFFALSDDLNAMLITADKKLYAAVKNVSPNILLLSDF
jgi:predicted nucleic acid-binding protein